MFLHAVLILTVAHRGDCCVSSEFNEQGDAASGVGTSPYWTGNKQVYEFYKPLRSGETGDISIDPGDTIGFALEIVFNYSGDLYAGYHGSFDKASQLFFPIVTADSIFYDDFNSDTPGTQPLSNNAIGTLILSESSDGSIVTRGPGHGFSTNYVELQRDSTSGCGSGYLSLEGIATEVGVTGIWTATWKSVAYQTDRDQGSLRLYDFPLSIYAAGVGYYGFGDTYYNDGAPGQYDTGVPYVTDTPQTFKVVLDIDNKLFDLYIDNMSTPVAYGRPMFSSF